MLILRQWPDIADMRTSTVTEHNDLIPFINAGRLIVALAWQ